MIELAIFDLDGVLTESSEQHYQAWKILAEALEIPFDKTDNEDLKGISRLESLERLLQNDPLNRVFSQEEKVAMATKKNENYVNLIKNFTKANCFDGVAELLKSLKEQGIKIALASASHNAPFLVKSMEIDKYFDYIVNPGELKKGKPDPEIFMKAAEFLNIKYEQCIGFEDAQAGVSAIKSAGMYAVGIGDAETLKEADMILGSVGEFRLEML